jgi:flagellar hook-associated protein 1 FlgK
MNLSGVLNMAREGMRVQQIAVQTASQNIANAQTEGYSRQRVEMAAALPTIFPYGAVGTGVNVTNITRARDTLLDMAYRSDSSNASGAETRASALGQMQSVFGEPSDTGLNAAMDKFWSAWSDLANDPTNSAAKSVVVSSGKNLAATLNRFAQQIDQIDQFNREGMNADVNSANEIAKSVADINVRIIAAESGSQSANDLRDQRDMMLDKLSGLVGGQVIEHSNGAVAVYVGGRMLLDGAIIKPMTMNDGQPPTVTMPDNASPIDGIGGSLGARLQVSASDYPSVMSKLDAIANGLVQTVNAVHNGATTYNGNPAVAGVAGNFFDVTTPAPLGTDPRLTARGIRLAPTMTGPGAVAASSAGNPGPGNNGVASALFALRDTPQSLTALNGTTTASLGDYFGETVGSLATSVKEAQDEAAVQTTLASNSETRRQSVSGVSTDEELVAVIEHQHAYQAAARLVSVVDDMMATLVDLGR